jgi:membrane-associated phospholipid phosphatase
MSYPQQPTPTPSAPPIASGKRYLKAAGWLLLILLIVLATFWQDARLEVLWDRLTRESPFLAGVSAFITLVFAIHFLALGAILLSILDRRLRWRFCRDFAYVMLTQMFVSTILKQLVGRPRPNECDEIPTVFLGPNLTDWNSSFPSGHATGAFALVVVMSAYYPRWRPLFFLAALVVSLARIQLDRHFFSDTVAGAFLGWFVATWTMQYLRRRDQRGTASASPEAQPDPTP